MSSGYSFWGGGAATPQVIGPGTFVIMNPGQISVYDDFVNANLWTSSQPIGAYPGLWMTGASGTNGTVTPTNAQNGVLSLSPAAQLDSNLGKAGSTTFPLLYSNITKIVARFVFSFTNVAYPSGAYEAVFGFGQTGNSGPDGSSNLYGAFINFCPQYGSALPDWDTRATISMPQNGVVYGCYNGQYPTSFGYKVGTNVPTLVNGTWYEGIISMVPGVSAKFYMGPYGTPTLDKTCTVSSILTNTNTAGPIITVNSSAGVPGLVEVDKIQYAMWFTEGNKVLTDDQMFAL